jgi:hypothetical protein
MNSKISAKNRAEGSVGGARENAAENDVTIFEKKRA